MKNYLLLGGLALVLVAWWNQPYLGTRFCVSDGFQSTEDYAAEIHSIGLAAVETQLSWLKSKGRSEEELLKMRSLRVSVLEDATAMLGACFSERNVEHCRYIGPDPHVGLDGQPFTPAPTEQLAKYRRIVSPSNIEVEFFPYRDKSKIMFGYSYNNQPASRNYTKKELKKWRDSHRFSMNFEVCNFGCFCGES